MKDLGGETGDEVEYVGYRQEKEQICQTLENVRCECRNLRFSFKNGLFFVKYSIFLKHFSIFFQYFQIFSTCVGKYTKQNVEEEA